MRGKTVGQGCPERLCSHFSSCSLIFFIRPHLNNFTTLYVCHGLRHEGTWRSTLCYTIVTLTLQSTKVIYEVASNISHGSDDINRLARVIKTLERLLKATKRLTEHTERTNTVAEGRLLEDLKPLVGQCVHALREIPPKLVQSQRDSRDGRLRKAKKHAKVYLDIKALLRYRTLSITTWKSWDPVLVMP